MKVAPKTSHLTVVSNESQSKTVMTVLATLREFLDYSRKEVKPQLTKAIKETTEAAKLAKDTCERFALSPKPGENELLEAARTSHSEKAAVEEQARRALEAWKTTMTDLEKEEGRLTALLTKYRDNVLAKEAERQKIALNDAVTTEKGLVASIESLTATLVTTQSSLVSATSNATARRIDYETTAAKLAELTSAITDTPPEEAAESVKEDKPAETFTPCPHGNKPDECAECKAEADAVATDDSEETCPGKLSAGETCPNYGNHLNCDTNQCPNYSTIS